MKNESTTKLSRLIILIKAEKKVEALRFAAKLYDLGEHKVTIKRGAEFLFNPEFFLQLGYDANCVEDAFKALKKRFERRLAQQEGL